MRKPSTSATALFALLGACQERPDFVVAPDVDWPFFMITEGAGRSPEANGPYRWDEQNGAFRFGVSGVEKLHLLSVDLDALLGPRLKDSAYTLERLELQLESESCADGREVGAGLRFPVDVNHGRLFELEGDEFVPRALSERPSALLVPTDDPACFDTPPLELVPFGLEPLLYPPGEEPPGFGNPNRVVGMRSVGGGRVLVAMSPGVLIVRPGEPGPRQEESLWLTRSVLALRDDGGAWVVTGFDAVETRSTPGELELAIILRWGIGMVFSDASALVHLRWTEAGFGAPAVGIESEFLLRFVSADGAGAWIAGGRFGQLYRRAPGEREYRGADLTGTPLEGVEFREWRPGWMAAEPDILVDTAGALYFGSLERPSDFRIEVGTSGFEPPLVALGSSEGAGEFYWSLGTPEFVHRDAEGQRRPLTGYLPAEFASCAGSVNGCGRRPFVLGAHSYIAATPEETLVLGSSSCSALLEYEPSRGCARAVEESSRSIELVERRFSLLVATDHGLLVAGQDLLLLYAPWLR